MPKPGQAIYNRESSTRYKDVSVQGEIITTDTGDVVVLAALANALHRYVVRKVIINVYTTAAVAIQLQGAGSAGDPVYNQAVSPAIGPHSIEWGEQGYALPPGEGLEWALGAGGNGFTFLVEAHLEPLPGAVMTPAQIL